MEQLTIDFDTPPLDDSATWTPRDIWAKLSQRVLEHFREDRRIERKNNPTPNLEDLASYYSTFSNTPDGGLLVYGIQNNGEIAGCGFSTEPLNKIETCHVNMCPLAKPEFKRVSVIVDGQPAFCLAIFVPYIGRLVETNKDEAWIRYGDTKHKMSAEEKQDFRATRQELAFELAEAIGTQYPQDFDLRTIQDFCDQFRAREQRPEWSNEDILIDRHLLRTINGEARPCNSLLLLAGKDPGLTIPGCRIRIQRFDAVVEGSGESYAPLKDHIIEGNLVQILQRAQEIMATLIFDVTWLGADGKFVTTPEYPQHAWQEAIVNACVHRSYSFSGTEITVKLFPNRLEVESPGGFVPPVNEQTIYDTRASRNHHLMDALRYLGYVRMAREGTRRIRESMNAYRLPEPVFKQEAIHGVVVRVTLKNDMSSRKRASDRDVAHYFGVDVWRRLAEHEIKIAAFAFHNGSIQVSDAQRITGRTWSTSKKDLNGLTAKGVLIFEPGNYVRDFRARYKLVPKSESNATQDS